MGPRIWDVTTYPTPEGKEIATAARAGELSIFQGGKTGPGASFTPGLASFLQQTALGDVTTASFGADSRSIITASGDGVARLYSCNLCGTIDDLQDIARKHPIWHYGQPEDGIRSGRAKYFTEFNEIKRIQEQSQQALVK